MSTVPPPPVAGGFTNNHLYYPSQQRLRFFQQQQAQHRMLKEQQQQQQQQQQQPQKQQATTDPPQASQQQRLSLHQRRHVQFAKQLAHHSAVVCDPEPPTPRPEYSFRRDSSCSSSGSSAGGGSMSRRQRLASLASTDSSTTSSSTAELAAGKSNYKILLLGSVKTGKTSIVRQFLYDQFTSAYKATVDDMYRGEFDIHGQSVSFDLHDVSGSYVYEFPGMRDVSVRSADAFVLVFALDDADTWDEVARLRDLVHDYKDADVPIVVVANKSDLAVDAALPYDSLEATVIFDWENGYVEASAKERRSINKIFKELLQQAKRRYDFTLPQLNTASALVNAPSSAGHHVGNLTPASLLLEDNLKRRQSLPAVPAGMELPRQAAASAAASTASAGHSAARENPLAAMMNRMHVGGGGRGSQEGSPCGSGSSTPRTPKGVKRRSSLAVLRRDSCRIS